MIPAYTFTASFPFFFCLCERRIMKENYFNIIKSANGYRLLTLSNKHITIFRFFVPYFFEF